MSTNTINYKDTLFEKKELTRIIGKPTYLSLQRLKNELKANAMSVPSTLGGGNHGHLGQVLTPVEYARVSGTPYVRPAHPGPVVIPNFAIDAVQIVENHKEEMRRYSEVLNVEKALKRQIVKAIDTDYISTLRNRDTNTIELDVATILQRLFRRYGKLTSDKLKKAQSAVESFQYNLTDPLESFYQKIEDLRDLGDAANKPYTEPQLIGYALDIIKNTHDFEDAQKEWNRKLPVEQTWENFKIHFEEALEELEEIRGETMRHTSFHQAQLVHEQTRKHIANELTSMEANLLKAMKEEKENIPPNQQEHAFTMSTQIQTKLLEALTQLTSKVDKIECQLATIPANSNRGNDRTKGPLYNVPFWKRPGNKRKYCWTCGSTWHTGAQHKGDKDPGHKDEATFENRMGGSEKGIAKRFL